MPPASAQRAIIQGPMHNECTTNIISQEVAAAVLPNLGRRLGHSQTWAELASIQRVLPKKVWRGCSRTVMRPEAVKLCSTCSGLVSQGVFDPGSQHLRTCERWEHTEPTLTLEFTYTIIVTQPRAQNIHKCHHRAPAACLPSTWLPIGGFPAADYRIDGCPGSTGVCTVSTA